MDFINKMTKLIDKYKLGILSVFLSLVLVSGIFGMSFFLFYNNNLRKYEEKNYNFKIYSAYLFKKDTILYSKLKESKYIVDTFYSDEYKGLVRFNDSDSFYLNGTISNNIQVIKGRSFDESSSDEIVCPTNFSSNIEEFFEGKTDNIEQYLGQEITFTDLNNEELKMKLVGVVDATDGFYEPNECFTSHKAVRKINESSNEIPSSAESTNLYIQIDDNKNLEQLKNDFPSLDFSVVAAGDKDVRNLVCGVVLFIYIINLFLLFKIVGNISKKVKKTNNLKEMVNNCLKIELKPMAISCVFGVLGSVFIGSFLISKIIPSVYLFYNSSIKIAWSSIILNIILISIIIIMINIYYICDRKIKKDEEK